MLGTADLREIEARVGRGDRVAAEALDAMAYQIAKEIGAMATVLHCRLDGIVLWLAKQRGRRSCAGLRVLRTTLLFSTVGRQHRARGQQHGVEQFHLEGAEQHLVEGDPRRTALHVAAQLAQRDVGGALEAVGPLLGAVVTVTRDLAMREAKAAGHLGPKYHALTRPAALEAEVSLIDRAFYDDRGQSVKHQEELLAFEDELLVAQRARRQ